jgi:hypothetical protein
MMNQPIQHQMDVNIFTRVSMPSSLVVVLVVECLNTQQNQERSQQISIDGYAYRSIGGIWDDY